MIPGDTRGARRWLVAALWAVLAVALVVTLRRAALRWSDFVGYRDCGEAVLGGTYGPHDAVPMPYWVWPPFFAYLCVAAAWLARQGELLPRLLWAGLNLGLLALVARRWMLPLIPPDARRLALPLSLVGCASFLASTVAYHQINALVLALLVLGLARIGHGRSASGGVLLGLAGGIKVWPAFLLPWLLLRGERRAVGAAVLTGGLTLLAPALLFGPARALELTAAWLFGGAAASGGAHEGRNQSLNGVLTRLLTDVPAGIGGFPQTNIAAFDPSLVTRLALGLGLAVFLWLSVRVARRPTTMLEELAVLAPAALLLVSPLLWRHYLVVLLGGAALAAGRLVSGGPIDRTTRVLLGLAVLLTLVQEPALTGERLSRAALSLNATFLLTALAIAAFERLRVPRQVRDG
ncbi:MAG: glycosyltransferase family 87 protein [Myxococcales bacterium]